MSEAPGIKFNPCSCGACLVNACDLKHGCECTHYVADSIKLKVGAIPFIEIPELKICDKRRYESQREAEIMIEFLVADGRADVPLKCYTCHICHTWHLTSSSK